MKQVLLTGLAAALTVAAVSKLSPSEASQEPGSIGESDAQSLNEFEEKPEAGSLTKVGTDGVSPNRQDGGQLIAQSTQTSQPVKVVQLKPQSSVRVSNAHSQPSGSNPSAKSSEVTEAGAVKVGTVQPPAAQSAAQSAQDPAIATMQVHQHNGRQAATIYVRNIPVVTLVGAELNTALNNGVKVATVEQNLGAIANPSSQNVSDPIWRATTIAGRLNQLSQSGLKAQDIKVVWDARRKSYMVRTNDQHLMEVSEGSTLLPKTTKDTAQDALQITNRLRYQLGNAAPLKEIEGMPKPVVREPQVVAVGPIRFQVQGLASWYGPGFHGNYTANGERFNQYDLTAAHRYLPFGTRVRVTNLDNGRSVVVRINDRGPFVGDRVLDLSRGAAQILGTVSSGVSAVRLDILQ